MVGPAYDFLQNPHGAVRLTFEKAASACGEDPAKVFVGKDWGAVSLFDDFLFRQDGIARVPFLDQHSIRWIKPNSLVRFRGMIQDMFGGELYVGAFKDGLNWRTNKFMDVSSCPVPYTDETRLWERRLYHCVTVPGQNSWASESSNNQKFRDMYKEITLQQGEKRQRDGNPDQMDINCQVLDHADASSSKRQKEEGDSTTEELMICDTSSVTESVSNNVDSSSFSCLIKTYDMPESELKLNDVIEFIGIYTFDPELVVHKNKDDEEMFDLLEDDVLSHLPPSKVPRLHCLVCQKLATQDYLPKSSVSTSLEHMVHGIRETFLEHLTATLGNDGLAAQFVLLHLLSRLRKRSDTITVGKLSLNLISLTKESASVFGNQLVTTIQKVLPFSQTIPLTIQYLNSTSLQPRKNNQTGRLVSGVLQVAQGTHLTFDETCLEAGQLNSNGVENIRILKTLMEWQKVEYDFEFYKLDMAADVQMLVLSEAKSNILPAELVVPFRPTTVCNKLVATDEQLQAWRWYLATLKDLPYENDPETLQKVQEEMVEAMKQDRSVGASDLNRWLTMAELVSSSFGENSISMGRWQMAKEMERLRKERLKPKVTVQFVRTQWCR